MSTAAPQYCFVVEDARGDSFELDIVPSDDRAKQHFQRVWQRLALAVEALHEIEMPATTPGWAAWQPWKWCEDRREAYQPRQKFVAWCGSNQVGILNIWAGFASVHEPGKRTLYIEHVGAAPGNLDTELWKRRYRRVGRGHAARLRREGEPGTATGRTVEFARLRTMRPSGSIARRTRSSAMPCSFPNASASSAPRRTPRGAIRARRIWRLRWTVRVACWRSTAVPEPRKVDFKPRWMTTLSPEEEAALDSFAGSGGLPTEPPRIDTRILPRDQGSSLSLRSLSEVAELTQKLADYAGYDVVHGPNPDFADLRSVSADLTRLTRLTSEPFAAGSFMIPACLQADPLEVVDGEKSRRVQTDDVARRFGEILTLLESEIAPTGVSIGALQTLEAFARILGREANGIEFSTADGFSKPLGRFQIGDRFIARVREVLVRRRPSQDTLETLEGRVTALDVIQGTLLLTVEGVRRRVKGNFSHMFTPSLLEAINRQVRLQGIVERRGKQPAVIHIHRVEIPDVEES